MSDKQLKIEGMASSKMQIKIEELKDQGYWVVSYGETRLNNRFYKFCKMTNGTETIVINHRGGTEGLNSALKKQHSPEVKERNV